MSTFTFKTSKNLLAWLGIPTKNLLKLCKAQQATLAIGRHHWSSHNPTEEFALTLANGLQWGSRGRVPTPAPSGLKLRPFERVLFGSDWPRFVSTAFGHPEFWIDGNQLPGAIFLLGMVEKCNN